MLIKSENRDFLLFMPNTDSPATLHAVFTFYSDILTLSSEGDSVMSEKSLEGIGTATGFLLSIFFGSIIRIAFPNWQPSRQAPTPPPGSDSSFSSSSTSQPSSLPEPDSYPQSPAPDVLRATDDPGGVNPTASQPHARVPDAATVSRTSSDTSDAVRGATLADNSTSQDTQIETATRDKVKNSVLIRYIPDPGYFIAGAVAGGVSRTATAPLDRLKVYLLVNTKSDANMAFDAAKKGRPILALKNAGRPLIAALSDLYKSGGVRGFFAGESIVLTGRTHHLV